MCSGSVGTGSLLRLGGGIDREAGRTSSCLFGSQLFFPFERKLLINHLSNVYFFVFFFLLNTQKNTVEAIFFLCVLKPDCLGLNSDFVT